MSDHASLVPSNFSRFEIKAARLLKLLEHNFPVALDLHPNLLADPDPDPDDTDRAVNQRIADRFLTIRRTYATRFVGQSVLLEIPRNQPEPPSLRVQIAQTFEPAVTRHGNRKTDQAGFRKELGEAGAGLAHLSPYRCETADQAEELLIDWLDCFWAIGVTLDNDNFAIYLEVLGTLWEKDRAERAIRAQATARNLIEKRTFHLHDREISTGVLRYFVHGGLMSSDGPDEGGVWQSCVLTPRAVMTSFKQVPVHLMPPDLPAAQGDSGQTLRTGIKSIAQMLSSDVPLGVAKGFVSGAAEGMGATLANSCGPLSLSAFRAMCAMLV